MKTKNGITADKAREVSKLNPWAGDDPGREGLIDTPNRVIKAYEQFFKGYEEDPIAILKRTFEEVDDYNDIVLLQA